MNKYKVGDMVEIKKGDRAIIVDFENDEAIIFNLSKMHPGKIKVKDIKEKVCEPNCKVVVEKVNTKERSTESEQEDLLTRVSEVEESVERLENAMFYQGEKLEECCVKVVEELQKIINIINTYIEETKEEIEVE